MPARRIPQRLRLIAGTEGATPRSRAARDGRMPKGQGEIGPAPEYLSEEQCKRWETLRCHAPRGLLTSADREAVAGHVVLADAMSTATRRWNEAGSPIVATGKDGQMTSSPVLRELRRLVAAVHVSARALGLTPLGRSSIDFEPPLDPKDDPLAKYFQPPQ
jgi:P27 family predicted phage terminase small subunit